MPGVAAIPAASANGLPSPRAVDVGDVLWAAIQRDSEGGLVLPWRSASFCIPRRSTGLRTTSPRALWQRGHRIIEADARVRIVEQDDTTLAPRLPAVDRRYASGTWRGARLAQSIQENRESPSPFPPRLRAVRPSGRRPYRRSTASRARRCVPRGSHPAISAGTRIWPWDARCAEFPARLAVK